MSQAAAGESLSVDLASRRGPSTGVGEGFLYGITQDGTQPADQFLQPLGINAFRGGGWFSGGWIKDNYQYGSATRADIDSITAQAKRLTQPPYHAQYQVLVSDIYGAQRRAAVEHEVPVRQRRLLQLGRLHRLHGGRAAGLGAARSPTTSGTSRTSPPSGPGA